MTRLTYLIVPLVLAACSADSDPKDVDASQTTVDAMVDVTAADTLDATTSPEVMKDVEPEVSGPVVPPGPESRGWLLKRGVVHLHSALSHDGCAPDGYEDNGGPDPECLAQLRAAPCANDMDFLFMTDHPGHSEDHTFEEMLQYNAEAKDELVFDDQDRPFANRMTCADGSLVDEVLIYAGTEGTKHMPIGMAGPIPPKVFQQNYKDESPLEDVQEAAALIRDHGGYVYVPHPEEKSLSVERIVAIPLDGMEIYNIHANLMSVLESLDTIFAMDRFLEGATMPPEPDLIMLLFLSPVAKDVEKFDASAAQIRLAHIAATDIHQNFEVPALCPGGIEGSLCEAFAEDYPNFAAFAMEGGPVPLSDGDRVDSYDRSFRWISNRALVADSDPQSVREAIGLGRSYSAFDLFGYPAGFDYYLSAGEEVVEMGEETPVGDGLVLHFNNPVVSPPPWRVDSGWDFAAAEVTCELIRADDSGSATVLEVNGQGGQSEFAVDGPGAYRVYCAIIPTHLSPVLPGVQYLANQTYPYIYSNAIFVR